MANVPSFEIRLQFMEERHVLYCHAQAREGSGTWRNIGADRQVLPLGDDGYGDLQGWVSELVGRLVLRRLGAATVLRLVEDSGSATRGPGGPPRG